MKKYPQSPEEWNNPDLTIFRKFEFRSTPDLECLMRLVKDNLYDGGNEGYLRARLLGILRSMYSEQNARFWLKHYHPKTWRIRMVVRNIKEWYHRTFKTRYYKGQVMLCNIAKEVIDEHNEEEKKKEH